MIRRPITDVMSFIELYFAKCCSVYSTEEENERSIVLKMRAARLR